MTAGHSRFAATTDGVYESLILRIQEQLIKSQPFFVHRRTQQSPVDTILRLKAKIVLTVQK